MKITKFFNLQTFTTHISLLKYQYACVLSERLHHDLQIYNIYTCYTRLIGDVDFSHDIALLITF